MTISIWIIVAFAAGLGLGLAVSLWLARARHSVADRFQVLAQEALRATQDQFLTLSAERFRAQHGETQADLEARRQSIEAMVKPVATQLDRLNIAVQQLSGTDQAIRQDLMSLQKETARLAGALHNPAERGRFGEYILKRLLDRSGLIEGQHYQTQVSFKDGEQTLRPDVVIDVHDQMRVVIDSKAPIYDLIDDLDNAEKSAEIAQKLAAQVRDHVRALARKDYTRMEHAPDFTVLFLPGDHIYALVTDHDRTLLEYAAEQKVLIASPLLMIGLLRIIVMMARQVDMARNARDIADAGAELHIRLRKFMEHFEKIGRTLHGTVQSFNAAIGSMERMVLPKARQFEALRGLKPQDGLSLPDQIELAPRVRDLLDDQAA